MLAAAFLLALPLAGADATTTTRRDAQGRTTGTETTRGNTTTYQHLSSRSVSVGTYVAQGQVVGITGTTGVSSGPHLHFEITENGKIINPLNYLTDYIKGW